MRRRVVLAVLLGLLSASRTAVRSAEPSDPVLPRGVVAEWEMSRAWRESTPTRERICLNGLWRWQPAAVTSDTVPGANWGYFKVPGSWPGITDYMQKDSQTVHAHPSWKNTRLGEVSAAWHQREFSAPAAWAGRRIALDIEYLNSVAMVYVDGRKAGEPRYPGGELDLSDYVKPGEKQVLSLLVVALPLKGVLLSYNDSARAREVKGNVARRGLCGDLFLTSTPKRARLGEARVATSVRRWELGLQTAFRDLEAGKSYVLAARIQDGDRVLKEFQGAPFRVGDLKKGRLDITEPWKPENVWDIHTPEHQYDLYVSLLDEKGAVLDALPPSRFGFREFWIEGRDFYLNGTRVYLSAVPLDNAQVSAAAASYAAARESLERLRSLGINFVYAHNYGCEPGSHLSFSEILRAADDVGMLVALSQPHFSHYDWNAPGADRDNGYAEHAAFYAGVAGNHPSVVLYSTSHNATGYSEDMNPDLMGSPSAPRDNWATGNVRKALRAEAIIRSLDPSRVVYHHASGNLGSMHVSNFYPNFVPVQELSDWFAEWSKTGTKPVFLCEYGAPFSWDWAMYRGWYKGNREFGSAVVPWEFCLAEWNAQFLGDRAFDISEMEKRNLRWEARQFREGRLWHRWDYPHQLGSTDFPERDPVFARYFSENWRAFRTWGLSAISPWEHGLLFKLRPGMNRNAREELPVSWANLQRPGFSADYLGERYERMDLAYDRKDWLPTGGGEAILRNNQPRLAWLAGKSERFTSGDHVFRPGETFEKQVIIINSTRKPVHAKATWALKLPPLLMGQADVVVETGQQHREPLRISIPEGLDPGEYVLAARVDFDNGETQTDEFRIQVLPERPKPRVSARVAVFDPRGETTTLLQALGVGFQKVGASTDLSPFDVLVIGKRALDLEGAAPDLHRVRDGLKVLIFEQSADVLERRLGFRVTEYGLRDLFLRVPDHAALAGLKSEHLRDWRGEATLLPPRLEYELSPQFNGAPTVKWSGIPVTRAWRCGNQGNVASVLIEKPARGDFLPLVDGGFSQQYSPLMEYREGGGLVVFCQLDVTGRSESEPAAENLAANLLEYVNSWKPGGDSRQLLYVGDAAGRESLEALGFRPGAYVGSDFKAGQVLMIGPGAGKELGSDGKTIAAGVRAGGRVLALGLGPEDAEMARSLGAVMTPTEHISAMFEPAGRDSPFAGIGPADVHCRDPRVLPLVSGGARVLGDGVLAISTDGGVVFCALAPWQFDYSGNYGLKRTFRRTAFLAARLLANLGVRGETPLLSRFATPVKGGEPGRWLSGFYLDQPEEWDDPYRFFRW